MKEQIDAQDLYARALRVYGKEVQVLKVMEELAELGVAFTHWLREPNTETLINLHSELADAQIVLEQVSAWIGSSMNWDPLDFPIQPRNVMRDLSRASAVLDSWFESSELSAARSLRIKLDDAGMRIRSLLWHTQSSGIVATIREEKLRRLAARLDAAEAMAKTQQVTMRRES